MPDQLKTSPQPPSSHCKSHKKHFVSISPMFLLSILVLWTCGKVIKTYVNKQTKGGKPHDADDKVNRPVNEAAAKGQEPEDGQQHGDGRDGDGVDVAAIVPCRGVVPLVQELTRETGNDGGKDQLRHAEDHGDDIRDDHFGGLWLVVSLVIGC